MSAIEKHLKSIIDVKKEVNFYLIKYEGGEEARLYVVNDHVFRYYMPPSKQFPEYPQPDYPEAKCKITVKSIADYDSEAFNESKVTYHKKHYIVDIKNILIEFDKSRGTMSVHDRRTNRKVVNENKAIMYTHELSTQTLVQNVNEYYFGGGMQNGRFTHKGEIIDIVNTNKWVDGGVTSPSPFYWSTFGYGVLRHTWQPGHYDFGKEYKDIVKTTHYSQDFDAFFVINSKPRDLLRDYYELTGHPALMPEYAFYEAHLNTFNRDYWVVQKPNTPGAVLFEDGFYYKKFQPAQMQDKAGILESLNGEKYNYQFSAKAMIDRYKRHDLPIGWFVPNDGYGSGYGQTDSLDGDIDNLKQFGDYARKNGIELAVWTESHLHPSDPDHPKKGERDLNKEVGIAGVAALKTDVAWIGYGYSFALNGIQDAADTFLEASKSKYRPMIISVDGWAGTQRCSGIWSGDQSGGEWEYIRFHIPTYIGAGLSGIPNVGSDMDGIYYGGDVEVNIRDFQWKTFTPIQLNMDGWGNVQKTPFAFGEKTTRINRAYLKLKSSMMPYNYSIAYESIHGLPMIRAMLLEFPEVPSSYTKVSQYQFMWGPNLLIAPIYNEKEDRNNNSLRDGIFLPYNKQIWIDFLTGKRYMGGKIYNNFKCPLWKIPIFVKDGAIIPLCNPNNNPSEIKRDNRVFLIYPNGLSNFVLYEDDGVTIKYLKDEFAITDVNVRAPHNNARGDVEINISRVKGTFDGIVLERTTELLINLAKDVHHIKATINGKIVSLEKVNSLADYNSKENVFYFDRNYKINPYLEEAPEQSFLCIKIGNINVYKNEISIKIEDYENNDYVIGNKGDETIAVPKVTVTKENNKTMFQWNEVENAVGYEVDKNGVIYFVLDTNQVTFDHLSGGKSSIRIRTVTHDGVSKWSPEIEY